MTRLSITLLTTFFTSAAAMAENVGIDFENMPIGTTLVTEIISNKPFRLSEKYIGREGAFFVTEVLKSTKDGGWKPSSTSFYDAEGRLVRRDREKGFEEYTPYSCFYVTGPCSHDYQYPNPFKNYKQTRNNRSYESRLEGKTLHVSWKLADGEVAEIPFELGPYNLRVSNEYKNRLGQDSGFRFVELIEPGRSDAAAQEPASSNVETVESSGDYCTALYERLNAEAPGDVSICTPEIKPAKTEQCRLPSTAGPVRQPAQVVLVMDASGSMAGKVGGKQKMAAAKAEASTFLTELARDVPVGLVVYGHKGSNKEADKAASCAGVDWALPMGASRSKVKSSVDAIKPTGWTPMARALDFVNEELVGLKQDEKYAPPVVFVVSDGKETCEGDPVAAAKALHDSGSKALVYVIGFDVDAETRAQLEAISEAGGGTYFAAKDSAELGKQLRSVKEAVNSRARFEVCLNTNQALAETVYNSAANGVPACFVRESERKTRDVILKQVKAFTDEKDKACAPAVRKLTQAAWSANIQKMTKLYKGLNEAQRKAGQDARARAEKEALPAK